MALQQKIPILPSPAIASYSYTDIAEGTGVVSFEGYTTEDNSSKKYRMGSNISYSSSGKTNFVTTAATDTAQTRSSPFETSTFILPKTIRGTSQMSFSSTGTIGVTIYKHDSSQDIDETHNEAYVSTNMSADFNFDVTINQDNVFLKYINFGNQGYTGDVFTIKLTEGSGTSGNIIYQKTFSANTSGNKGGSVNLSEHFHLFNNGDIINIRIYRSSGSHATIYTQPNASFSGNIFTITNQTLPVPRLVGTSTLTFEKLGYTEIVPRTTSNSGSSSKVQEIEIPKTHFKSGESLVFFIDGNNTSCELAHDPENKDQGSFTAADNHTNLQINIPFKLNL